MKRKRRRRRAATATVHPWPSLLPQPKKRARCCWYSGVSLSLAGDGEERRKETRKRERDVFGQAILPYVGMHASQVGERERKRKDQFGGCGGGEQGNTVGDNPPLVNTPNHQRWYTNGSSVEILYIHIAYIFCMFGANLYAQSVLINKISASELSRKFISALLVEHKMPARGCLYYFTRSNFCEKCPCFSQSGFFTFLLVPHQYYHLTRRERCVLTKTLHLASYS